MDSRINRAGLRARLANLSREKLALLEKKLNERGRTLSASQAQGGGTASLDNTVLFQCSLNRSRELMERDVQLQEVRPSQSIVDELARTCRNSIDYLASACRLYADRPAMGNRVTRNAQDPCGNSAAGTRVPEFRTLSYRDLWGRIERLAGGLFRAGFVDTGHRVGICGFGSPALLAADYACLYLAAASVPLPLRMPHIDLKRIVEETEIGCVICSLDEFGHVAELALQAAGIRHLVVADLDEKDDAGVQRFRVLRDEFGRRRPGIRVTCTAELESVGSRYDRVSPVVPRPASDPLMTVVYTSGSTGTPKGALYPESVWSQYWSQILAGFLPEVPAVSVSFLPLNHLMSRIGIMRRLLHGGTTYFTSRSDMSTLFEDIRLVRPTMLNVVPRISQTIYHEYQAELMRRCGGQAAERREAVGRELMAEMRTACLGDRLLLMTNGSAPIAPQTLLFLKKCFRVPVIDGYGSTEAGFISRGNRIQSGNVRDYKLADVPELRYFASDKPYPRGELRIKSRLSIPGYLNSPEASRELYDGEGYLKTGDVVEERAPGEIAWIDRTTNVLKLSQGEFVSLGRLEALYSGSSRFIDQIYLYGTSERPCLLAVVVPDCEALTRSMGPARTQDEAVREVIRTEISEIASRNELQPYEVPRDFMVEWEPFSLSNGLLTESHKLARPNLRARYGGPLENLYECLDHPQPPTIGEPATDGSAEPVEQLLKRALGVSLGVAGVKSEDRFRDLGGDSLDSIRFSNLVHRLCGVRLPAAVVLDEGSTVRDWAGYVVRRLRSDTGSTPLTCGSVHGDTGLLSAGDLRLEKIFAPRELDEARLAAGAADRRVGAVLLTGAAGFLGRSLLAELMDHAAAGTITLRCLVRAPNAAAAAGRLFDGMGWLDSEKREVLRGLLGDGRISVMAGDLISPRLGMDEQVYDRAAEEIDCIIHGAALVNHILPYAQLFEPNVVGTVEVMKLAAKVRRKSVNFVSSVAVTAGTGGGQAAREDDDVRTAYPVRIAGAGYAAGYAASKWACEVMLRELHEKTGVPVEVFRCGMILPDSRRCGRINLNDWFTRLLCGLIWTGIAPSSFYDTRDAAETAHFGGLPVECVGRFIAGNALCTGTGYRTYHLVNPGTDQPVSLDRIVEWVRSAGYRIGRVPDYAAWYSRFQEKLMALDESRRRQSPLSALHQWQNPIGRQSRLDTARFVRRYEEISRAAGEEAVIPNLSERYIHKCLSDLQDLELIRPD
jgi:fatty acid CoA ligase FadD9